MATLASDKIFMKKLPAKKSAFLNKHHHYATPQRTKIMHTYEPSY